VLERLVSILEYLHSKQLVCVDLKPQNLVLFGSLLDLKLIDLECIRKVGEQMPFKLTPFYASPELAAAAIETMRTGGLPELQWGRSAAAAAAAAADPAVGAGTSTGATAPGSGSPTGVVESELGPPEPAGPSSGDPGEPDRWGSNLAKVAMLSEQPTLSRAVAAVAHADGRGGDPAQQLGEAEQAQLG